LGVELVLNLLQFVLDLVVLLLQFVDEAVGLLCVGAGLPW
jgi:hypothetical protein